MQISWGYELFSPYCSSKNGLILDKKWTYQILDWLSLSTGPKTEMCQIHIFEIEKKVICNFKSFSQNENNLQIERPILHLGSISWLLSVIPWIASESDPPTELQACIWLGDA